MDLNNDELVSVLRALHWHVDRLINTDQYVRDQKDLDDSVTARDKLTSELKRRAYIK
jgi:hypothetical protein